jgi:hypothetical protein
METLIHERESFGARNSTDGSVRTITPASGAESSAPPNDDTQSAAWQRGWADAQE